jgi:hypothetical protein
MTPVGLWQTISDVDGKATSEVRVIDTAGVVSAVVEKALTQSGEPLCDKCTDDRKGKPKVGMQIIRDAKKADGKSNPYACPLFLECKAQTTRTNGCFDVDLDVCVTQDGVARINKVTGTSMAVEFDVKTPAKVSACSREAEWLAKEHKQ